MMKVLYMAEWCMIYYAEIHGIDGKVLMRPFSNLPTKTLSPHEEWRQNSNSMRSGDTGEKKYSYLRWRATLDLGQQAFYMCDSRDTSQTLGGMGP